MVKEKEKATGFQLTTPQAVIVAGLLIAGGIYLSQQKTLQNVQPGPSGTVTQNQGEQGEVAGQEVVDVSVDDDAIKGDDNAPVTIVEFSEYQCPYCKMYVDETYLKIVENYVDTGKVKYVFRDFPLEFHPHAQKAAEAAECAGEQGKYWEYHNKLFEKQEEWTSAEDSTDLFKSYAADLGLKSSDFDSCLDSEKYKDEVSKDFEDGQKAGVSGTPTFFIGRGDLISYDKAATQTDAFFYLGDKKVGFVGAQPYSEFERIIEEELSK